MSLNDLQLSPDLLARLYPSSLIAMDLPESLPENMIENADPQSTNDQDAGPAWKYLGDNLKKILVVVNYPDWVHLPDDELSFLTNMLAACKLGLADVAIINQFHYKNITGKNILSHFQSTTVFLFGVDPISFGLPVRFPPFQVQNVAGCTFLFTPGLEELRSDALLKSKLWVSLRGIFGI